MSSFLPNVIVSQTLQEVKVASLRDTNKIAEKVQRGLDRLYAYQHDDGGWGWWKDDKTDAFMTAYVVDGLQIAKQSGYAVDDERINRARAKLKEMLDANRDGEDKEIDLETRAYMIYAMSVSGGADGVQLNDLYNRRNELQPYGRALLALALKSKGDGSRGCGRGRDRTLGQSGRRKCLLGVEPSISLRLRREQDARSHRPFDQGAVANLAAKRAAPKCRALAGLKPSLRRPLGLDQATRPLPSTA